jgi:hypothetical protein
MGHLAAEDVPALVVALLDADIQEQAFHFIVINNKAVRVPADNVKSILAGVNEQALQERLLTAGVRYGDVSPMLREVNDFDSSPFRALLDWDYNRKGQRVVPLTAIEQALRFAVAELPSLGDDDDSLLGFFFAVWRGVRTAFPTLWGVDGPFMKKVSLNALNEFVVHRMKMAWEFGLVDVFVPEEVEQQALKASEMLVADYWTTPWNIKIQDNANVRGLIFRDLEKMVENHKLRRRWSEDLSLIAGGDGPQDGVDGTCGGSSQGA